MDVLTCVTCGTRLTEPLDLLRELPPRPAYDGRENPDGPRHAPATVPRGRHAVDPEACGAPCVPHPGPEWVGAARPGNGAMEDPDGQGFPMSAGPRDTVAVHSEDTRGWLSADPAVREIGCCGMSGREGSNEVCAGCGTVVATLFAECSGPRETHFLPAAVRAEAA